MMNDLEDATVAEERIPNPVVFVSGDEVSTYFVAFFPRMSSEPTLVKLLNVDKFHAFPNFQHRLTRRYKRKIACELAKFRRLEHRSIVRTLEIIDAVPPGTIVTSVYQYGSLLDWILSKTTLYLGTLCHSLHQICSGLEYLHKEGHAHGHLRPSSILFKTGAPESAAITMNTSVKAEMRKLCYPVPIELEYCPPELIGSVMQVKYHPTLTRTSLRSNAELDEVDRILSARKESDMWCLGIIACIILTGSYPWQNATSSSNTADGVKKHYHPMLETFSPNLQDFLVRLLWPRPAGRATAAEGAAGYWYHDAQTLSDARNLMYILDYGYLRAEMEFNCFAQKTVDMLRGVNAEDCG
ncbi:hypothetical protein CRM22_004832 [Opisthorchis felineus]|uniref:Protein kinase domain-containing protein n=1 Tax=Opisthorchis felineus TaxID=147828 RepID=A0A4V3SF72_OPIFE|nr:hypothetical protein CRM22_004832 [Opisthorchis felineus]